MTYQRTLDFHEAIAFGLKELGVKCVHDHDSLAVERDSMVQSFEGDEDACCNYTKDLIKTMVAEGCRVMWSGRSDDYLWVEVYQPNNEA